MNYPRLDWFICVFEEGGITKASEKLFLTQQSVSAYIKRLEENVGAKLFVRGPSFLPTSQGKLLYKYAKKIVDDESDLKKTFSGIQLSQKGRIRFGITVARAQALLPKIAPLFFEKYPNVELVPIEANTAIISKKLINREVDLYYGKDFKAPPEIEKKVILNEKLYVVASDNLMQQAYPNWQEKIAQFHKGVYLSELTDLPFINIDPSGKVSRPLDSYFKKHNLVFHSVAQANHMPLLIDLCGHSIGAGICLEAFLPKVVQKSINVFPVIDHVSDWKVILAQYRDYPELECYTYLKHLIQSNVS